MLKHCRFDLWIEEQEIPNDCKEYCKKTIHDLSCHLGEFFFTYDSEEAETTEEEGEESSVEEEESDEEEAEESSVEGEESDEED